MATSKAYVGRKVMRRCTLMQAASEQRVPEEDLKEELYQKAVAKAEEEGSDKPERDQFDAQKALDAEVRKAAVEEGFIDEEGGDAWADSAPYTEIIRLDAEIETIKKDAQEWRTFCRRS